MVVRNIINFTKSLSYDNLETSIDHFDQIMILYQLIGNAPGIIVSIIDTDKKKFRITSTDASFDLLQFAKYLANSNPSLMFNDTEIKLFVYMDGNSIIVEFV